MRVLRKALILVMLSSLCVFAHADDIESDTLNASISSVSMGENNFGWGLFPTGTTFYHYKYFKLSPESRFSSQFRIYANFSLNQTYLDTGYDYEEGTPYWSKSRYKWDTDPKKTFPYLKYFRPAGYIEAYFEQPIGVSPVEDTRALVYLTYGYVSEYQQARESLDYMRSGNTNGLTFVNADGTAKSPFLEDADFSAFPWLEGNRKAWSNMLYLESEWYFYKYTGREAYDGAYADIQFEFGPWWFMNTITPKDTVTSDYWRLYAGLTEKITLYQSRQSNGLNWFSICFVHTNSYDYYGGDVLPFFRIPHSRLRNHFSDYMSLFVYGPEFLGGDSYPYIKINLSNSIHWGHVVNERSNSTTALTYDSSFSMQFHVLLFGFLNLDYQVGYQFTNGIYGDTPYWWQNAEVSFYVSL